VATAIWWIRRDLRLTDNQALHAARLHADQITPAFVLDPAILDSPDVGPPRVAFLLDGLRALDADLRRRGSRLVIRHGNPLHELAGLAAESGASAIFAEEDHTPYSHARDARVANALPLHLSQGVTLYPPDAVRKADGLPYTVFTPYSRAWRALPMPASADVIPAPAHVETPAGLDSLPIPDNPRPPTSIPFPAGEEEALRRLERFTAGVDAPIYRYAAERDRPALDGISQLSPYFHLGMLSARQAIVAARMARARAATPAGREGVDTWITELIWREFYITILHHFPHVLGESFRPALRHIEWSNDEAGFANWTAGQTGYPIVDAAMRQLLASGWMHNRARMIVASFLVKDLLIDWRRGERWFMQRLVDGDTAANNGGWQWTAGTGADAAPYFRVFSPTRQGLRYDPEGEYVRRWAPELRRVPDRYIHEPWKMPAALQSEVGCRIGSDYPAPLVDHALARLRTLDTYQRARAAYGDTLNDSP
jgi:deoxyribodipyrimidine photo-lyase